LQTFFAFVRFVNNHPMSVSTTANNNNGIPTSPDSYRIGMVCHDPSGLCVASRGTIDTSGVYTTLIKLAAQLAPAQEDVYVTIECAHTSVLVKESDGHVVAVRVPSTYSGGSSADVS
jgi:hypothetical protein